MSRASLFAGVLLLMGCNSILQLERRPARNTGGDGGTSDGGGMGGGGDPGCVGEECFPPPPNGWTGPIVFAEGAVGNVAGCAGDYGTEELVVVTDMGDATHRCPCTCGPPTGITCTVTLNTWDNVDCTGFNVARTFDSPGQCQSFGGDPRGANFEPPVVEATGASCAATVALPEIPDVTWGRQGRACGPVDGLEEIPPGFAACVLVEGDVPCEGEAYTDRTVWYDDVDDDRMCDTDCACGAVINAGCDPLIESHRNFSCSQEPKITPAEPGCVQGFFDSALLVSITPTGMCEPVDATATGAATPIGPTTVCCTPPS